MGEKESGGGVPGVGGVFGVQVVVIMYDWWGGNGGASKLCPRGDTLWCCDGDGLTFMLVLPTWSHSMVSWRLWELSELV